MANPVVRLGLHLLGRRQQVSFAKRAGERMARLTAADGVARAGDGVEVRSPVAADLRPVLPPAPPVVARRYTGE